MYSHPMLKSFLDTSHNVRSSLKFFICITGEIGIKTLLLNFEEIMKCLNKIVAKEIFYEV